MADKKRITFIVMNLPNGHLLQNGKYSITDVVGQGGFGITYKGVWYTEVKGSLGTIKTDVPISIKEYFFKDYCYRDENLAVSVHSETGEALFDKFKEKLIKEARILSDVNHPYIVNVLEVFEENNTAYIVMEYISGLSLKQLMDRKGSLPEKQVLKYVQQIGEALTFVHENNILHLDIKPSNILIDKNDDARLIDFGVSKRYDIEQQETSTTMLTLSKGFASIEQYDNEGTQNFSPCPDIYSLGATMYNLLTGVIPVESILRATKPLQKPTEINPSISVRTEQAILKAMQIVPADRFQTIREMMDAMDLPVMEKPKKISAIPNDAGEGDTTLIFRSPEAVQLPSSSNNSKNTEQKKRVDSSNRKKVILLSFFIASILIASGITYWNYANKPSDNIANVLDPPNPDVNKHNNSVQSIEDIIPISQEQQLPLPEENSTRETTEELVSQSEQTEVVEPSQEAIVPETPLAVIHEEENQHLPSDIDMAYTNLIESGKSKLDQSDFDGARSDFTEAKNLKMTEEVFRLIIDVDQKEEQKKMIDRKAQYEQKMPFGDFIIVRKTSTGLYGAIDSEGYERIPCKYKNVGNTGEGRAFEREDNLFDIYNESGDLINAGSTYY